MSGLRSALKSRAESLPEALGRPLARVPFSLRLGYEYPLSSWRISKEEARGPHDQRERVFAKFRDLVRFANEHVEFYRQHYRSHGFNPSDLRDYDDICKIPVVTKANLQSCPLSARCAPGERGLVVNTGGTSGQPLEFMLDSRAFAREWAHMHHIWQGHGYRVSHLKLTFRGKHFSDGIVLRYNPVHNEYVVNASAAMADVVDAVVRLPRDRVIRWVHGYPSLVAEFAHAVSLLSASDLDGFSSRLFGVLLGSEYPAAVYRNAITSILSANVVSWYGHSEMSVLARETALGVYSSYPTYGLAEAVPDIDADGFRLVCTSLGNRLHPFIRYDTGDLIEPVSAVGASLSFRIKEGRVGDFVLDRNGQRLSLTAIIFGRHQPAFAMIRHVQVCDMGAGRIILMIVPKEGFFSPDCVLSGFDLGGLDADFEIELIDQPIRTRSGKICLKVDHLLAKGGVHP